MDMDGQSWEGQRTSHLLFLPISQLKTQRLSGQQLTKVLDNPGTECSTLREWDLFTSPAGPWGCACDADSWPGGSHLPGKHQMILMGLRCGQELRSVDPEGHVSNPKAGGIEQGGSQMHPLDTTSVSIRKLVLQEETPVQVCTHTVGPKQAGGEAQLCTLSLTKVLPSWNVPCWSTPWQRKNAGQS